MRYPNQDSDEPVQLSIQILQDFSNAFANQSIRKFFLVSIPRLTLINKQSGGALCILQMNSRCYKIVYDKSQLMNQI